MIGRVLSTNQLLFVEHKEEKQQYTPPQNIGMLKTSLQLQQQQETPSKSEMKIIFFSMKGNFMGEENFIPINTTICIHQILVASSPPIYYWFLLHV